MSDLNHEEIANNWGTRGFSCDLWIDKPGQRWEDFTHETDEIIIVLACRHDIICKIFHLSNNKYKKNISVYSR